MRSEIPRHACIYTNQPSIPSSVYFRIGLIPVLVCSGRCLIKRGTISALLAGQASFLAFKGQRVIGQCHRASCFPFVCIGLVSSSVPAVHESVSL